MYTNIIYIYIYTYTFINDPCINTCQINHLTYAYANEMY